MRDDSLLRPWVQGCLRLVLMALRPPTRYFEPAVGKVFWSTSRGTPAGVVHSSSMARGTSYKPKLTSGVHLHRPTYPATPCSTWAVLILRHGIFDSAIDLTSRPGQEEITPHMAGFHSTSPDWLVSSIMLQSLLVQHQSSCGVNVALRSYDGHGIGSKAWPSRIFAVWHWKTSTGC